MTAYAPQAGVHRHRHVNLWAVAAIILAAALVGLGAWVIVDRTTGSGGATHDATTLIDQEYENISAGNVDAATALFTPNAVVWQGGDTTAVGTVQIHKLIAAAKMGGFTAARTAPVTVNGEFATTYFSTPASSNPVLGVFQLRDGKIFREWDFELGQTAPFDTARP